MASLDEILALESATRELLHGKDLLPGDVIDPRHFEPQQLGLRTVMIDKNGRLWDVGTKPWKLVYCPVWEGTK